MSVRPHNRLAEMPMMPVECHGCGAQVLARKSSWQQTSVQWNAAATARCLQRRQADVLAPHGRRGLLIACSALNESIVDEACRGRLPVVDGADQPVR